MKNILLLPRKCKLVGAAIFPFAATWLIATYFGNYSMLPFLQYNMKPDSSSMIPPDFLFGKGFYADFNGEVSLLLTLASLFMIAFSREKVEDEYVSTVRLRALQISVYASYLVFAVASVFIYGTSFLVVMFANIFTVLLVFIAIFHYSIYRNSRAAKSQMI